MRKSPDAASRSAATARGKDEVRLLESCDPDTLDRQCDFPGCTGGRDYRAPKAPDRLRDYHWFCLDHIRAYNRAWNYCDGMNDAELEQAIRGAVTWERPSWPFGVRRGAFTGRTDTGIRDAFGLFNGAGRPAGPDRGRNGKAPGAAETRALSVMELSPPLTLASLKARYKELVKRNHPDRHGGSRAAEERLKKINEAYTTLKDFLS